MRNLAILCLVLALLATNRGRAEGPSVASHIIHTIPLAEDELVAAHKGSKYMCRTLAEGEPLQIHQFAGKETLRLADKNGTAAVPFSYSRVEALNLGLDMLAADRKALPFFSGGIIQGHLDTEYISIQVQVLKDSRSGAIYLHHQPFGAIALYSDRLKTHEFTEQSKTSAQDFRGLGLYIKPGQPETPENARTLVATNMATMVTGTDKDGKPITTDCYELVMVRAEVNGDDVTLHAFGTSHTRTQLHYLQQIDQPTKADDCSVKTILIFTQYKLAGQVPVTSASRDAKYHGRGTYELDDLDKFAAKQGWKGGWLVNLTETLDAIIAGQTKHFELAEDGN
ncbi:MAG: hypothetical protein AB7O62_08070 [Pirellulales bacterium]